MVFYSDKSRLYFNHQMKQAKEKAKIELRSGKPFITISRQVGAYGMTIAESLAKYLQKFERRDGCPWTVFDKGLVQKVIEEHRIPETVLPYFSESAISEIQDTMEEIFGLHPSQWTLVHKMSETIFHLATLGYVILVGRGANIITRKLAKGFHVRLIGSREKRITHVEEYYELNEKDAKAFLAKEERGREQYIRKYFNKNINAASLYDLVINTDTLSVDQVVKLIGDFVLSREQ